MEAITIKNIRKILSLFIVSFICVGTLAGCASSDDKTYSEDTLNVWASMINGDKDKYTEIAEKWSEKHNGMKVNFIQCDASGTEFIQNDKKPDILLGVSTEEAEKLVKADTVSEMPEGLFNDDEFVSKDLVQSVTINGKKYGVPFSQNSVILFYNKDKVNKVPDTFEGVIDEAKDVGFTTVINDRFYNYGMLSAYGGYFFKHNEDGTFDDHNIGIDTEAGIKGLELVNDIVNKYKFCIAGTTDMMAARNFEKGKCGYYIGEYGRIRTFTNDNINFGVAKLPNINGKEFTPLKRTYMSVVDKNSSKKDLAWDFIRYFMDEASEYIMTSNPKAPVLKKTLETDAYKNTEYLQEMYKQSLAAEPLPNIMTVAAYENALDNNIGAMTLGQIDAKECAESIKNDLIEGREMILTGTYNKDDNE